MSKRVIAVGVAVLVAACHDRSEPSSTATPIAATAVAHAPAPAHASPPARDFSLARGLEMRRPIRDGHLTIIPIVLTTDAPPTPDYLALDDAMARKLVTVRDIGSYTEVRVHNKAEQPLFVMAGELVLGGEQDHAFGESRIIGAGDTVTMPVYCVEQGRSEGGRKFRSGHALVDVGLRQLMRHGNQQQVWQQVERDNARLGLTPPTKTYRLAAALQDTPANAARRDHLAGQLAESTIVGLVIAFDGEIIAVDRFPTPAIYRAHQTELLGSYIAGDDGAHHEGTMVSPDEIRRFAAQELLTRTTDASSETLAKPPAT